MVGAKADVSDRERDIPAESLEAFGAYHGVAVCEVCHLCLVIII